MSVSPGINTKIEDLSNYVEAVPGTVGFVAALTQKGRDNQLLFQSGKSDFITEFGEPNYLTYGKNYGQGPYIAYNYLGQSSALYFMRCMPDDAAYSNITINSNALDSTATVSTVTVSYSTTPLNTLAEVKTAMVGVGNVKPVAMLYPIGRGEYYNQIGVRLTQVANPLLLDTYTLDIYEKQSDGSEVIVESYQVSFEPTAVDLNGDSIWIVSVLERYSNILRAVETLASGDYTDGYYNTVKVYDKNVGTVSIVTADTNAAITDSKQNFTDWQSQETGQAAYEIEAMDQWGNKLYGWLGQSQGNGNSVHVFSHRNLATGTKSWMGDTTSFVSTGTVTYRIKKVFSDLSTPFVSATPTPLRNGSDGSLLNADGSVNPTTASQVLGKGYSGTLTNPITDVPEATVLDTENYYFTLVFDAGYPQAVKQAIANLVTSRQDCIAITDIGDNSTSTQALTARTSTYTYNNYLVSMFDGYSKISDSFTGQDIFVSPCYHMASLLPLNDRVSEIWYGAAGFTRGAISTINELRYTPNKDQRDQLYLKQINPIVKFSSNYVVFGQLTSQTYTSALSDINIVRLVLYIKKALEDYTRNYIFELNDSITWGNVSTEVTAFLEQIKKRRGLYDYSVEVSATDYEKKTKKFHVNITLNPTRLVEQIDLNFSIV